MTGKPEGPSVTASQDIETLRALALRIHDIVLIVRRSDWRVVEANPSALFVYGYEYDEMLGLRMQDLRLRVEAGPARLAFEREQADGIVSAELHRRKDGSTFPTEVSVQAWFDEQIYLLYIVRDASEHVAQGSRFWTSGRESEPRSGSTVGRVSTFRS